MDIHINDAAACVLLPWAQTLRGPLSAASPTHTSKKTMSSDGLQTFGFTSDAETEGKVEALNNNKELTVPSSIPV